MRRLWRRMYGETYRDDTGSVLLALFAILIMTSVIGVGFSTLLVGQDSTRHDSAYAQALQGAETGLSKLVAALRTNPANVPAQAGTSHGQSGTVTYSAQLKGGGTNCSSGCNLLSTGTATVAGHTVHRTVQQLATVNPPVTAVPLFGGSQLFIGENYAGNNHPDIGSAADIYDSAVSSNVCAESGGASSMATADTRMCDNTLGSSGFTKFTNNDAQWANAATNGYLNLQAADVVIPPQTGYISQVFVDNTAAHGGEATDQCSKYSTSNICNPASNQHHVVVYNPGELVYPQYTASTGVCANGKNEGSSTLTSVLNDLSAGGVFNFTNVTLNLQAILGLVKLENIAATPMVICFSGDLNISSLNGLKLLNISALNTLLTSLLGSSLGGLLPPINSTSNSLLNLIPLPPYTPKPPSNLVFIDTAPQGQASNVTFGCDLVSSLVNQCAPDNTSQSILSSITGAVSGLTSSLLANVETSLSAVVYAPQATCTAQGHVDVYGELICGSLDGPSGLDVHYDTELNGTFSEQPMSIGHWVECRTSSCS